MAVSKKTIEEVRQKVNILEIISPHVRGLKKSGRNWLALCPFHQEKTPSFSINQEKGFYHCFGCGEGGDVFSFLMAVKNYTLEEAVRELAARVGVVVEEAGPSDQARMLVYKILAEANRFYHQYLQERPEAEFVRQYLKKRGVDEETREKFQLGFCPDGNEFIRYALNHGYTAENLLASGVAGRTGSGNLYEYMRARLVFPIFSISTKVVAFGGRAMREDQEPKYLNTPETIAFVKGNNLYGIDRAVDFWRKNRRAILVEGYFDVIIAHRYGLGEVVAPLGTALTSNQARQLERYVDEIILLFDSDEAGNKAALRSVETLLGSEVVVKISSLPAAMDIDDYLLQFGRDNLEKILKDNKSFVEFKTELLLQGRTGLTPEEKSRVVRELIGDIQRIVNQVYQQEMIRYLAFRLDIPEDVLRREMQRTRRDKFLPEQSGNGAIPPSFGLSVLDAEELLLRLVFFHPEFLAQVPENLFTQPRCQIVLRALGRNIFSVEDICQQLPEADRGWFRSLVSFGEEEMVAEKFEQLIYDLQMRQARERLARITPEINSMLDGIIPLDENKIEEYNNLLKLIKGK